MNKDQQNLKQELKRAFTEREAANYIAVSYSYLRLLRNKGVTGNEVPPPPYHRRGVKKITYYKEDLDAWLDQFPKEYVPGSEPQELKDPEA